MSAFLRMLWSGRERPRRDEADTRLKLYGRRAYWRSGSRGWWL